MTKGHTHLDELLSDPMVQLVMKRDSVRPEHIRSLLERVQAQAIEDDVPPAHIIDKGCGFGRLCL